MIMLEYSNIISLTVQFTIILVVILAVLMALRGRTAQHCRMISAAVILQVVSVLVFMSPFMSDILKLGIGSRLLITQIWIHHLAGIAVVILVIYINLAMNGRLRSPVNNFTLMRLAFSLWLLVFMGGLVIYLALWHGISLI